MTTEASTRPQQANLDPALQQAAEAHEAALREFLAMTQPAVSGEAPADAPIGAQVESEHAALNEFMDMTQHAVSGEAPAFTGDASAEITPWYEDSPAIEAPTPAPVEAPAPNPWFTTAAERPVEASRPQLVDQGEAGTHTALRTGGWVDRDAPLREAPAAPAADEQPATGSTYRSEYTQGGSNYDADEEDGLDIEGARRNWPEWPEPARPVVDYDADYEYDEAPAAPLKPAIPNFRHAADLMAAKGMVVPASVQKVKDDYERTHGSQSEADDAFDAEALALEGSEENLDAPAGQDPDAETKRRRRMLITGPATFGAWLGVKQANLAESRAETYERLPAGMRRMLRIADGVGIVALAVAAKTVVQTVLTVKGIMGPSYGAGDAFRDTVDGLFHHHSSLVDIQHHDVPPQGDNSGVNTAPYDYDSSTRTAHENDPLSHRASNVTDWSKQSLEWSLRHAGIPEDEVQRMANDPDTLEQLNQTFYHQNPVVGEDANHWLNADDTYRYGDVEKQTDQMAAHRAAELGIHQPNEATTGTAGLGKANGNEAAPAAQDPNTLTEQERYEHWLATQVTEDALIAAATIGGNAAFAASGKTFGTDAARVAQTIGVGTNPPRTGRIRSALRRVLRRGPRP